MFCSVASTLCEADANQPKGTQRSFLIADRVPVLVHTEEFFDGVFTRVIGGLALQSLERARCCFCPDRRGDRIDGLRGG